MKLPKNAILVSAGNVYPCVRATPHAKTGGRKGGTAGPPSDGTLRIVTNLLDPPAEVIADIYRHRWTIELFFRFFKHILGCRHLLSQDRVEIEIQTYCAIIACLLIRLTTGCKPTLRTYEMICLYLQGWADEEEFLRKTAVAGDCLSLTPRFAGQAKATSYGWSITSGNQASTP